MLLPRYASRGEVLRLHKTQEKVLKSVDFRTFYGASVLIGLFKKRCHTNDFSDFRVADFLVFTLQAVPEVPKSKPTS